MVKRSPWRFLKPPPCGRGCPRPSQPLGVNKGWPLVPLNLHLKGSWINLSPALGRGRKLTTNIATTAPGRAVKPWALPWGAPRVEMAPLWSCHGETMGACQGPSRPATPLDSGVSPVTGHRKRLRRPTGFLPDAVPAPFPAARMEP